MDVSSVVLPTSSPFLYTVKVFPFKTAVTHAHVSFSVAAAVTPFRFDHPVRLDLTASSPLSFVLIMK